MKQLFYVVLILLFFSCNSDDNSDDDVVTSCANVECDVYAVALEFRDAATGEDLFFNETLSIDDLMITDAETGSMVEFAAFDSNQGDVITVVLSEPEEQIAQNIALNIFIESVFNFNLSYDIAFVENPCCPVRLFNNFEFDGIDFQEGTSSFFSNGFVILVEL